MGIKVANNAFGTLAASITNSDTSITLTTGQGARFPSLGAGDYFYATLIDTSNNLEIVKCTARSTDVLTVVRAQESTTARAYSSGDRIEIRITAATFTDATVITPAAVSDQANTSTGYFDLPAGTTAQRPGSPASGMIRFNTTIGEPEWYNQSASSWLPLYRGNTYDVEYIVVAGGGGGGANGGGGGGAGGYRSSVSGESSGGGASAESVVSLNSGQAYSVVVGAGGAGSTSGQSPAVDGSDGAASSFAGVNSVGGGGGGSTGAGGGTGRVGRNGGSGGGASKDRGNSDKSSGTAGQGYAGGASPVFNSGGSGGGGGAGAAGGNGGAAESCGAGGIGVQSSINGTPTYRAGGGGGGSNNSFAVGGTGGGGAGGPSQGNSGSSGTVNTGGGGGGGNWLNGFGGAGGSGIVIIRYFGSQRATGGTVTSASGYTVHTFTSSGTFTA